MKNYLRGRFNVSGRVHSDTWASPREYSSFSSPTEIDCRWCVTGWQNETQEDRVRYWCNYDCRLVYWIARVNLYATNGIMEIQGKMVERDRKTWHLHCVERDGKASQTFRLSSLHRIGLQFRGSRLRRWNRWYLESWMIFGLVEHSRIFQESSC